MVKTLHESEPVSEKFTQAIHIVSLHRQAAAFFHPMQSKSSHNNKSTRHDHFLQQGMVHPPVLFFSKKMKHGPVVPNSDILELQRSGRAVSRTDLTTNGTVLPAVWPNLSIHRKFVDKPASRGSGKPGN